MASSQLSVGNYKEMSMSIEARAPEYKEADRRTAAYKEADRRMAAEPVVPAPLARQGVTGHNVRYVLGFSIAAVVIAFVIVYFVYFG